MFHLMKAFKPIIILIIINAIGGSYKLRNVGIIFVVIIVVRVMDAKENVASDNQSGAQG